MRKRTVLYFDHTARLGGGEIALFNLIQEIDPLRFIPVVVLGEDGPLRGRLCQAGIETHLILLNPEIANVRKESLGIFGLLKISQLFHISVYAYRLAHFMKIRKPDFIHTNSLKSDIIGAISARLSRIPIIWHVRDRISADYLPLPAAWIFRLLCQFLPDRVIANSRATLATIGSHSRRYGAGPTKRYIVHDGVPQNLPESKSAPANCVVIGLVGRIAPWKGQHVFIKAASLVRQTHPDVRFQIIGAALFGEERYEAELQQLTRTLNLSDSLEFTGFQEDINAAIQRLSIVVHASTTGEPFGQVVIEAMHWAKPVIATNGGAIPEIIEHERTGLLVPMNDPVSLASSIVRLISHPDQAAEIGNAGRRHVRRNFTMRHTATRVMQIYDALLSSTSA